MRTPFSRLLGAQRVGMDKAVVGQAPPRRNQTGIDVKVAIFFDGTGNNRNNVAQRHMSQHNAAHPDDKIAEEDGIAWTRSYEQHGLDKKGKPTDSSYAGGYSNVSILEQLNIMRRLPQKEISIYVEGIGTINDSDDATLGNAIGTGSTGIPARVLIGAMRIADNIRKILKEEDDAYVEQVTVDVFGFSRGAAAARHFISLLHAPVRPLKVLFGTPKAKVEIKFVGIFDTVSSFSAGGFNNVDQLGLRIGGNAKKVVHLTAGNEYRRNFSLTDITSSLGIGYELTLPGVHSDIGGGYAELEQETRQLVWEERQQLVALGWYTPQQIKIESEAVYDPETGMYLYTRQEATGVRLGLRPDYQLIPLRIMAEQACKVAMELFALSGRYGKYAIAGGHELAPVQAAILAQVGQHGDSGRHALTVAGDNWQLPPGAQTTRLPLNAAQIVLLRHRYLHRSASTGVQGLNDGMGRIGMGERREHGQPHRQIYTG